MDEQTLDTIAQYLQDLNDFAITAHVAPDGDSIGSMLALYQGLKNCGKKAVMIMEDPLPSDYHYLPCSNEILKPDPYDLQLQNAIYLDCSDLSRAGGKVIECLSAADFMVNIDHHADNSFFCIYQLCGPAGGGNSRNIIPAAY